MVKFNIYNVATLLERLYFIDDDGNHYPIYKESISIEDVLDEEATIFFRRIYDSLRRSTKEIEE